MRSGWTTRYVSTSLDLDLDLPSIKQLAHMPSCVLTRVLVSCESLHTLQPTLENTPRTQRTQWLATLLVCRCKSATQDRDLRNRRALALATTSFKLPVQRISPAMRRRVRSSPWDDLQYGEQPLFTAGSNRISLWLLPAFTSNHGPMLKKGYQEAKDLLLQRFPDNKDTIKLMVESQDCRCALLVYLHLALAQCICMCTCCAVSPAMRAQAFYA